MFSIVWLFAVALLALHFSPASSLRAAGVAEPSLRLARSNLTASAAAVPVASGTLRFIVVTREAPWSARSIGAVELFSRPVSFRSVEGRSINIPQNAFVLHGGSGALNDVWVSSDHGRTWLLAAGETIDGKMAASAESSFTSYLASAVLIDYSSNIYRIGGRTRTNGQDEYYGDVFVSSNAVQWTNVAEGSSAPFDSERFYANAVATSTGEIVLQGGTINNFAEYKSDVWSSTNGGKSWSLQTAETEFGTRGIGVLLHSQHSDRLSGKDILYTIGGQNEKDNNNEGRPTLSHLPSPLTVGLLLTLSLLRSLLMLCL